MTQQLDDERFLSQGLSRNLQRLPLFQGLPDEQDDVRLLDQTSASILDRIRSNDVIQSQLEKVLIAHQDQARPLGQFESGVREAGKNTYTYDAHTYHTKVPPQGIATVLASYLPEGGIVLDPFAGSGMTGVAARRVGIDSILVDLSPAAAFVADRFTSFIDPALFDAGVDMILKLTLDARSSLYATDCRECGKETELLYTVWSYNVECSFCSQEFNLWDVARSYGKTVREHRILSEFECPHCNQVLKKSRLKRSSSVPVEIGYKCCGSKQKEQNHPPNARDFQRIAEAESGKWLRDGYYPTDELPHGINLRQPISHGLTTVHDLYTKRNLSACSHIWWAIHRIDDPELAGFLAFVFTSLYKRITKLSEFRFWGGSGNTANLNVPFISNESNVFLSYLRKARTIRDHLQSTALHFSASSVSLETSATDLSVIPDNSVDLVFTDPPFGGYINYSDMNFLWESWLGRFTETSNEAIVNRVQQKDVSDYGELLRQSFSECHRVLRDDGAMVVVFMNSSASVWDALHRAIYGAGFSIADVGIFDKKHGTFKQFVSDNTPGYDLIINCVKGESIDLAQVLDATWTIENDRANSIQGMLEIYADSLPHVDYAHVIRESEINFRLLYSRWIVGRLSAKSSILDFSQFRSIISEVVEQKTYHGSTSKGA